MKFLLYILSTFLSINIVGCAANESLSNAEYPEGCYARQYSEVHLSRNPNQQVTFLRVLLGYSSSSGFGGEILAMTRRTSNYTIENDFDDSHSLFGGLMNCNGNPALCKLRNDGAQDFYTDLGGFYIVNNGEIDSSITIETMGVGALIDLETRAYIGNENNCMDSGKECLPIRYKLYKIPVSECIN